ncbi:MAG: FAD-binding protein [Chloroflexi bacterium]|nr:FAD-binding protein [Chloroflexota bacterium]
MKNTFRANVGNIMRKGEVSAWDTETEVLVVGCGFAGAAAAIDSHDLGAKVLIIEKEAHPAGCSPASGGNLLFANDVDKAYTYIRLSCGGRTPDDVIQAFCEEAHKHLDYIKRLVAVDGAEYAVRGAELGSGVFDHPGRDGLSLLVISNVPGFVNFPWYPSNPTGGTLLIKVLMDNIEARRVPVMFSTPATELVQDEMSGQIVGVAARQASGRITIKCTKAVILACGGFEQDEGLRQQFTQGIGWISMCHTSNTGDGIRMAQKVGAGLWHMWHIHGSYGFWFPELGRIGIRHGMGGGPSGRYGRERKVPWIVVDKWGKRYMNELAPMPQDLNHRPMELFDGNLWLAPFYREGATGYPRIPSWIIFDEEGRKLRALGTSGLSWNPYVWSRDNTEEIKKGWILKAATLNELAAMIKADPQNDGLMSDDRLENTVTKWNDTVASGKTDPDFLRGPRSFFGPVSTPPFYAVKVWPMITNTQGGPVHNARQQVLDSFGNAIPRLYAVGELGSLFGHVYETQGNVSECFTSGRIAARNGSAEKTWN